MYELEKTLVFLEYLDHKKSHFKVLYPWAYKERVYGR